jgi:hypothetical protein
MSCAVKPETATKGPVPLRWDARLARIIDTNFLLLALAGLKEFPVALVPPKQEIDAHPHLGAVFETFFPIMFSFFERRPESSENSI